MSEKPVLAVDLDGTLVRTDMLVESVFSVTALGHWRSVLSAVSGVSGRAGIKARFASAAEIDPEFLPYNESVLALIRAHRAEGGRVALVTAADDRIARAIAEHIGLFDEVHASNGTDNLKGPAKVALLESLYGAGNFDYVGDSAADLPVWKAARRAITVGASQRLRSAAEQVAANVDHLPAVSGGVKAYLRALRPHQWLKNSLLFLPVVGAHSLDGGHWYATALAFMCFCLVASSIYILNDLFDLSLDRSHPRKKRRPFASGDVPLHHGAAMAVVLFLVALAIGLSLGRVEFLVVIAIYVVATTAYSLFLKQMLLIDMCFLAGFYTLRVIAGGAATGLPVSVWLLGVSIFIFFSLAAVKRQAELVGSKADGRDGAPGRALGVQDIPIVATMAIASGYVAVLVMVLYLDSQAVQALYPNPQVLWGICPVLIYWISRMVVITHRGGMEDDPLIFAIRDRASWICGALIMGLFVLGSTW